MDSPVPQPTFTSLRPNALANKLTTILSTTYGDSEIRDTLEILDARRLENTPEARRQLRLDVQKEVIQSNGMIVQDFGQVAEQLRRIKASVDKLNGCCDEIRMHINAARQETGPILEEAGDLLRQSAQAESKQRVLDAFISHFSLNEEDAALLTSTAEPANSHFFDIMAKAKRIHKDCQILLGAENQTLGLEILEQSSKHLNAGFQKLYRWIQREFKSLDLENPQINTTIRRGIRVLAERPSLFQSCLNSFAETREHVLSDSLYAALTGSSRGAHDQTVAKPIELYAHDPLRYVNDMLAWTHSTTVSEREALEGLFIFQGDELAKEIQAGRESDPWSREDAEVFDGKKALRELLNQELAGVARILRQRMEQVIHSHRDLSMAYKISNVASFYVDTFTKLLGEQSTFLDTLRGIQESCMRQFRNTMREHVANVQAEPADPPDDLSAPEFLSDALEDLQALMKSYNSSLTSADSDMAGFNEILAEALEPFLGSCMKMAEALDEPADDIFAINCLDVAKVALLPFSFTKERVKKLDEAIDERASRLIDYQHRHLLHASGLHALLQALAPLSDSKEDLASIPRLAEFRPEALVETSQKLDDFLPSALVDALDNIRLLQNRSLAQQITEEAAERFCEDFDLVEGKIAAADELEESDSENEDEQDTAGLRELFPRTGAEIRVLLS